MTKKCTRCNLDKELICFSPKNKNKFSSRCKICLAEIRRINYVKHKIIKTIDDYKVCNKCLINKSTSEFYKNYNCSTYRNECRLCNTKRSAINREKVRKVLIQIKSQPCTDCKIIYPYYVMDFDHIDDNKEFGIAEMRFSSLENIMKEIKKCELVCSNCHRIRTFQRLNT